MDQTLVDAAINFIKERYPNIDDWDGDAAMYTHTGRMLISTCTDSPLGAAQLCHETGAICEAHKLNEKIVASVCVGRDPKGRFDIIAPCGFCQERLMKWGPEVEVAVPDARDTTKWIPKRLGEIQPYWWNSPYKDID